MLASCAAEAEWIKAYEPKIQKMEITELKRFFKLSQSDKTGQTCFITSKPLHLLYLGRRHPLKGVECLEAVVRDMPEVELRIVSDAEGGELERAWQWCEVLVLPTLSENFGRVVAEALERGKRVITTDGAPAWGDGNDYGGRLIYLKGYRLASPSTRVRLLKEAIEKICK